MKKFLSKTAVTLIELIVSITLVSIVLLGIFAVNTVLRNNNQDYGQRYLVRSQTQTTLNHILNNAALAVGSGAANDEGILIGAAVGDANSFCIHQGPNNNINNSNSYIWLCYTWSNYQINYCTMSVVGVGDPRGAASCNGVRNSKFLGTAFSISQLNGSSSPPSLTSTAGFSITIQNCLNNSSASCASSGTSADPANNPEVQVTGSVFPPQVSW